VLLRIIDCYVVVGKDNNVSHLKLLTTCIFTECAVLLDDQVGSCLSYASELSFDSKVSALRQLYQDTCIPNVYATCAMVDSAIRCNLLWLTLRRSVEAING
jgi:uncharacterized membrane protein